MTVSRHLLVLLCITGLLITACRQTKDKKSASDSEQSEPINVVTIETRDFLFRQVPDSIPEGLTTFRVKNEGVFPHNAELMRLKDGHTYKEFIEYHRANAGQLPEWASHLGGPSAPVSGEKSEATLNLKPGNYVIVCGVPVPAAEPHYIKGMTKALTVTQVEKTQPKEINANLTLVMDDYTFEMSSPIKVGTQTIQVENEGDQPHEFILVRLNEGKTVKDLIGWLGQAINAKSGPLPQAPAVFLNGVSPMDVGVNNYITVDFKPGNYALVCPFPDVKSGKPHFAHGMVHQFSIQQTINN